MESVKLMGFQWSIFRWWKFSSTVNPLSIWTIQLLLLIFDLIKSVYLMKYFFSSNNFWSNFNRSNHFLFCFSSIHFNLRKYLVKSNNSCSSKANERECVVLSDYLIKWIMEISTNRILFDFIWRIFNWGTIKSSTLMKKSSLNKILYDGLVRLNQIKKFKKKEKKIE